MTWHKGKLCIEHYSTAIWNFFDEKASKNKLYSTPKMAHRINNIVEEFQTFEIGSESTVYDQSNTGCQFAITLYLKNSILLLPPFVSTSLRPLSWFFPMNRCFNLQLICQRMDFKSVQSWYKWARGRFRSIFWMDHKQHVRKTCTKIGSIYMMISGWFRNIDILTFWTIQLHHTFTRVVRQSYR